MVTSTAGFKNGSESAHQQTAIPMTAKWNLRAQPWWHLNNKHQQHLSVHGQQKALLLYPCFLGFKLATEANGMLD